MSTETETWTEWGVRRTWGDVGSVARMFRHEAEFCAREWPGELVCRAVTAQPWRPAEPAADMTAEPEASASEVSASDEETARDE